MWKNGIQGNNREKYCIQTDKIKQCIQYNIVKIKEINCKLRKNLSDLNVYFFCNVKYSRTEAKIEVYDNNKRKRDIKWNLTVIY